MCRALLYQQLMILQGKLGVKCGERTLPWQGRAIGASLCCRRAALVSRAGRECNSARERSSLRGQAAHDDGGIGATKTERVRQHGVDGPLLRLVGNEVDGGLDRRIVEIERGRGHIVAYGEHG